MPHLSSRRAPGSPPTAQHVRIVVLPCGFRFEAGMRVGGAERRLRAHVRRTAAPGPSKASATRTSSTRLRRTASRARRSATRSPLGRGTRASWTAARRPSARRPKSDWHPERRVEMGGGRVPSPMALAATLGVTSPCVSQWDEVGRHGVRYLEQRVPREGMQGNSPPRHPGASPLRDSLGGAAPSTGATGPVTWASRFTTQAEKENR